MSSGLIWAGVVVALVGSYVAQQYLPSPKPKVVGIDLGTTFSCVGVYHAVSGKVEIFNDTDGHRIIPSVVHVAADGSIVVGHPAKQKAISDPANTIYEAKRFIGRRFDEAQHDADRFPFAIVDQGNRPFFQAGPQKALYSPEMIGSFVIKELKRQTETTIGGEIKKAVLAVPADFNERQRNATIAAGNLAGLEILRLLSEPTAAAMAYGLHEKDAANYVLVFDFGGGTLDVSLLRVRSGMFSTMAIAGNSRLGGEDLSHRLYQRAIENVLLNRALTVHDLSAELKQEIRTAVEIIKKDLSLNTIATQYVLVSQKCDPKLFESARTVNITISRQEFEEWNKPLFDKALQPVTEVLKRAKLSAGEIDQIVLVGGSTRIPKIRSMLESFFNKKPNFEIDPDEAVAVGVSIQAGILSGAWPLQVAAVELPFSDEKINLDDDQDNDDDTDEDYI